VQLAKGGPFKNEAFDTIGQLNSLLYGRYFVQSNMQKLVASP
jgi:hypothetical protein